MCGRPLCKPRELCERSLFVQLCERSPFVPRTGIQFREGLNLELELSDLCLYLELEFNFAKI
jgi:hypothetical protein